MQTKWQYQTARLVAESFESLQALNKMGYEGWELISVLPAGDGPDGRLEYRYFFKRPLEQGNL